MNERLRPSGQDISAKPDESKGRDLRDWTGARDGFIGILINGALDALAPSLTQTAIDVGAFGVGYYVGARGKVTSRRGFLRGLLTGGLALAVVHDATKGSIKTLIEGKPAQVSLRIGSMQELQAFAARVSGDVINSDPFPPEQDEPDKLEGVSCDEIFRALAYQFAHHGGNSDFGTIVKIPEPEGRSYHEAPKIRGIPYGWRQLLHTLHARGCQNEGYFIIRQRPEIGDIYWVVRAPCVNLNSR